MTAKQEIEQQFWQAFQNYADLIERAKLPPEILSAEKRRVTSFHYQLLYGNGESRAKDGNGNNKDPLAETQLF